MADVFANDQADAVSRDETSWQLSIDDANANTRMKNACAARTEAAASLLNAASAMLSALLITGVIAAGVFGIRMVIGWF